MTWIFDNWIFLMDWLAKESVTDWISVGAGYVAGCVILVSVGLPVWATIKILKKNVDISTVVVLIFIAAIPAIAIMFKIHGILNLYQAWYTTPLGVPLNYH